MNLRDGVEHLGSDSPFSTKTLMPARQDKTGFMYGCNARVRTYDEHLNENISSCNVTASIEIIYNDEEGNEVVLDYTDKLKLQLIRSSQEDYEGKEVLFTALKSCYDPKGCGRDECCFSNRCWPKTIVSKCPTSVTTGNKITGERCRSDLECASLCCNSRTATCGVHIDREGQQVLCSKAPGQSCVASPWCRKEYLPQCFNIKTGVTPDGKQLCAKRCYNLPTPGSCTNGRCVAPPNYQRFFDPDCEKAIDPPTLLEDFPPKTSDTSE